MFFSEARPADPISLQEMTEFLKGVGPIDSDEKIADCVEPLRRLGAGGPNLLQGLANQLLEGLRSGESAETATNSFFLWTEGGVSIRMNLWRPLKPNARFNQFNGRIYAYGFPHDHDFDLLTVGALGPGYTTRIFNYELPPGEVMVGDAVDATDHGEYTLSHGSVLLYEQSRDMHIQYPSPAFSASINLISAQRVNRKIGQYVFDADCTKIVGVPEYLGTRMLRVVEMLLELHDDPWEMIRELSRSSNDDYVARNIIRMAAARHALDLPEAAARLGLERFADTLRAGRTFSLDAAVHDV